MRLFLLNAVILAEDYDALRDWYMAALELELDEEWTDKFHYAELVRDGRLVVGIADAKEMGVEPSHPRTNTVVPQLNVTDVAACLERVKAHGGGVPFGPSYDADLDLHYGAFADIEGNQVWVVQMPQHMPE